MKNEIEFMKSQKSFFDKEHSGSHYKEYKLENWRISYLQRVFRALDIKFDDVFLDIGCGGLGYVVIEAARQKNCYSLGVDISPIAIRKAHSFAAENLDVHNTYGFIVCSATHLPFKNNIFSKVSLIALLEHIPDDKAVISEVSRICKSEAKVFVCVPNSYCRTLPILTLAKIKADKTVGHLRSYRAENLVREFSMHGFSLQSLVYHAHWVKILQHLLFRALKNSRVWWVLEELDDQMSKIPTASAFTAVMTKQIP